MIFDRQHQDGYFISSTERLWRGSVLPEDVYFPSVVEVRAVWPSPWDAELASLRLQRFGLVLALAACCCSLWFSPPG